ncbi:hypothetical protein [Amycolatopsis magusensis]|uniref:hypothetical protein n=1 Tax=Amycolatopsis magusensis TaxID=882444 RepID=UPI0037A6D520
MPVATITGPRLDIDPAQIAAAIGITADTGYQFTDAYGVTYTGAPAHLALSALARRDLTGGIYPDQPAVAVGIRATAATLIDWFTSPHADPQHAAEFAALPAMRVCELVVYLCLHGDADALRKVGPESLRYYTDHLLHDPVPSAEHPIPRLADQPYRSLARPADRLQVTATARDGADDVAVPMEIRASESIYWQFTAAVPVGVDELNELLMDPDYFPGHYLADRRELIDDRLTYASSQTEHGLDVTGRLAHPHDIALAEPLGADPQPAAAPIEVELFFVGTNRDIALSLPPFGTRSQAQSYVGDGDLIFTTRTKVPADAVQPLT